MWIEPYVDRTLQKLETSTLEINKFLLQTIIVAEYFFKEIEFEIRVAEYFFKNITARECIKNDY